MKRPARKGTGRRVQRERPAPIVGIEAAHDRTSDAQARRSYRFSQLLARAARDARRGGVLMTTSALSHEEHEVLARLTPAAHEDLRMELAATIATLRDLLGTGDPLFFLAVIRPHRRPGHPEEDSVEGERDRDPGGRTHYHLPFGIQLLYWPL
jgi:hypothetical protein